MLVYNWNVAEEIPKESELQYYFHEHTNDKSHTHHYFEILSTICSPKEEWTTKGIIKEMQKSIGREKEEGEGSNYWAANDKGSQESVKE